jgi:hypothetical protein
MSMPVVHALGGQGNRKVLLNVASYKRYRDFYDLFIADGTRKINF